MKRIDGRTLKLWVVVDAKRRIGRVFITRQAALRFMRGNGYFKDGRLYVVEAFPQRYTFR